MLVQIELAVGVDDGGGGNDDHDAIGVAISHADMTPNVATKCGPVAEVSSM